MRSANGAKENSSISSCIRSSCATLASGVVIRFALSSRRSMFVASTCTSSGACSEPLARTVSAQMPRGPVSTSTATSTDESTTTLNAGQRFGFRVSALTRRESVSRAFFCAPVAARPLPKGGQPSVRAQRAGIPASICPAMPLERLVHRGLSREHHECLFERPCLHNASNALIVQAMRHSI